MTTLRDLWRGGDTTLGSWLVVPSSVSAESMARQGFDYCCIDTQHGLCEYSDAVGMIQGVVLGGSRAVVRVPWNEPGIIGKVLDAGAEGVIVPMVNSVAEAEAAVAACRFPPDGARSHGPTVAGQRVDGTYLDWARHHVACIVMIETAQAVADIDAIVGVPGIDAVYVGPSDLSVSLGLPPGNNDDVPVFAQAIETVVAACGRAGVVAGAHAAGNPEVVRRRLAQGFRLLTAAVDLGSMVESAGAHLAAARNPSS